MNGSDCIHGRGFKSGFCCASNTLFHGYLWAFET